MAKFDKNKDSKLCEAERKVAAAARQKMLLKKFDKDGDGKLNSEERKAAIKATEAGIIKLSQDQRDFKWATNGKKLMTVPFDENPYSAMAAYFKTDEGVEIYKSIEKKLE